MSTLSVKLAATRKSAAFLLILAVVLSAVGSFYLIKSVRQMVGAVPVVVAKQDLPPHVKITPEMVEVKEFARGLVVKGMLPSPQPAIGRSTRSYIPAGTPLYMQQLAYPGDNTLTSQLTELGNPKMRFKSVQVDSITGFNGNIYPHDRVDLTGTMKLPLRGQQTLATSTFAKDVEVASVAKDKDDQGNGSLKSITFALTPYQAQDLDFVINNGGKIGISLRGYDAENVVTEPTTPESFTNMILQGQPQVQPAQPAPAPNEKK